MSQRAAVALRTVGSCVVGVLFAIYVAHTTLFLYAIGESYLFLDYRDWEKATGGVLPGLNAMFLPAFGMYLHWWGGAFIILIGFVQIFPFTRGKNLAYHRVMGNVYVVACILTSIGGNLFIYTHGCVGGRNMDVAFSTAGWILLVLAVTTWHFARKGSVTQHRNWAIRLWSQGVASPMYRIWYTALALVGYHTQTSADFSRPLDEFLDWWFFVPNLIVAEIVIYCLSRQKGIPTYATLHDQDEPTQVEPLQSSRQRDACVPLRGSTAIG